ncbi:MAG: stage II sporulation protein M [Candidatus Woesearchaeota archaeon]
MIEKLLVEYEDKYNFSFVFILTAMITFFIGVFTFFTFNHPYVLVGLLALALSYPTIRHLTKEEKDLDKLKTIFKSFDFFRKELMIYSSIFCGFSAGLFLLFVFKLVDDLSIFETIISSVTGQFILGENFVGILSNNLMVGVLTFTLSVIMFSGFLFVLSWNASILAYYLAYVANDKFYTLIAILPHLIFEIGGFILAGLAGNILMYGIEYKKNKLKFAKISLFVLFFAALFILIGAFLETV